MALYSFMIEFEGGEFAGGYTDSVESVIKTMKSCCDSLDEVLSLNVEKETEAE